MQPTCWAVRAASCKAPMVLLWTKPGSPWAMLHCQGCDTPATQEEVNERCIDWATLRSPPPPRARTLLLPSPKYPCNNLQRSSNALATPTRACAVPPPFTTLTAQAPLWPPSCPYCACSYCSLSPTPLAFPPGECGKRLVFYAHVHGGEGATPGISKPSPTPPCLPRAGAVRPGAPGRRAGAVAVSWIPCQCRALPAAPSPASRGLTRVRGPPSPPLSLTR